MTRPPSDRTHQASKTPSLWRVLSILIVPTILVFALITFFIAAYQVIGPGEDANMGALINTYIAYFVILNLSITFCILLLFLRRDGLTLADIGFRLPDGGAGAVLIEICLAIVSTLIVVALLTYVLPEFFGIAAENTGVAKGDHILGADFFLALFTSVFVASFVEEAVFRGYGITALAQGRGIVFAIIVSTAFFGFYHISYGLFGVVRTMFQGLVFALLFARSRSLLGSITAHSLTNLIGTFMNFDVI